MEGRGRCRDAQHGLRSMPVSHACCRPTCSPSALSWSLVRVQCAMSADQAGTGCACVISCHVECCCAGLVGLLQFEVILELQMRMLCALLRTKGVDLPVLCDLLNTDGA